MTYKFQQIEPAVACGKVTDDMWDSLTYVAEEKYDGDRRIAQFCVGKSGAGTARFTGRRQSVKDGLFVEKTDNIPHLSNCSLKLIPAKALGAMKHLLDSRYRALEGTVLDGEMVAPENTAGYYGGGKSKRVTAIMGSLPAEAIAKQMRNDCWMRYVVFDCLWYKGRDMRGEAQDLRRQMAEESVNEWKNPFVSMAVYVTGNKKRRFLEAIYAKGGEGIIIKDVRAPYGNKQAWAKVKGLWTADVVIMGYVDAKKISRKSDGTKSITKYAKSGLIGAVRVGQFKPDEAVLKEVATISGMSGLEREEFTRNGSKYVNSVVVLEHNGREPTMRFRHPRFQTPIIFRNDKKPKQCIIDPNEK
jgi:ATP-dependent DNA ligase